MIVLGRDSSKYDFLTWTLVAFLRIMCKLCVGVCSLVDNVYVSETVYQGFRISKGGVNTYEPPDLEASGG